VGRVGQGHKTIKVVVEVPDPHAKYGKYLKRRTVPARDTTRRTTRKEGDTVEIAECRPLSKTKHHRLLRIVPDGAGKGRAGAVHEEVMTGKAPESKITHFGCLDCGLWIQLKSKVQESRIQNRSAATHDPATVNVLDIADNTRRSKQAMCIKVPVRGSVTRASSSARIAGVGDVIICAVKSAHPVGE
jgi:small subunit ribosomal protein S17